jgi:hypothetical protein
MGRIKKYQTEDELKAAKAEQWKSYYDRNKKKINTQRMKKYYENKSTKGVS